MQKPDEWWETNPPSEDVPINRDTINGIKFYVTDVSPSDPNVSLWVEHTGGVEFPIMRRGSEPTNYSASPSYSGADEIEPTDEFYEVLAGTVLYIAESEMPESATLFIPENMANHENWAIRMVLSSILSYRVSFEIDWLIEEAFERTVKEEIEAQ
ncbi:hypothetical protein ACFQL7_20580 [Halocatena marina]|uniref:Uncharacterized protein n=1 Tax=Halocatena marina TaxID=2934937 RepID=A0ABD5YRS4_9EURY|nr:hypothetical protein [Halocatena marina]